MTTAPITTYVELPDEHGQPEQALVIIDMNASANSLERGETVAVPVASDRDPAHHYFVTVDPRRGAVHCTCPAGQHKRKCKHLKRAEAHVGFDAAALKHRQRNAKMLKMRVEQMLIGKRWAKIRRENLWHYCWTESGRDLERAAELFSEMAYRAVGVRCAA